MEQEKKSGGGYGKRPLWQWILLYVVIGGIVYGAIYYFLYYRSGVNYNNPSTPTTQTGY
jgi:hypothetical protein